MTYLYLNCLQTLMSSLMIVIGTIDKLIEAFSATTWVFYGLGIGALLVMRITHKDVPRPFEVTYMDIGHAILL